MILITSLACAFFLIWVFFLTASAYTLARFGETLSLPLIEKRAFLYLRLHRALFKKESFQLLLFATTLSENIGRIGFACASLFLLLLLPFGTLTFFVTLIVLVLLIFFIGDYLPRLLSHRNPESTLLISLVFSSFFLLLSLPLTFVFLKLDQLTIERGENHVHGEPLDEMRETIIKILHEASATGELTATDEKLIESVIKFKDRIVREVMIPRVDLFSLSATTTIRKASELLVKEGYSRTPVFRGNIDNIIGMLMYKDILEIYMQCEKGTLNWNYLDTPIETITKGVFYAPESKKVAHLLQEFKTRQMHMAIVVNEYGGTEGVVTIEDILEEIVGEIADEYDVTQEMLYTPQPGGGSWIVDARMSIKDAEDIFGIDIPQEGDYETIGGFLFHRTGMIPSKGTLLHEEGFDLEILSTTERSIEKVRITPQRAP